VSDHSDSLWIVYDSEDGVQYIGNDYVRALAEYEAAKETFKDSAAMDGFMEGEQIILAKVSKKFASFDTKQPTETDPTETYWDFKETNYDH
jgi:hypothetical protein